MVRYEIICYLSTYVAIILGDEMVVQDTSHELVKFAVICDFHWSLQTHSFELSFGMFFQY
jgi:hypothetical protein